MSSILRRLARQRHSGLAIRAFFDAMHFRQTGFLTVAQIEDRLLEAYRDIPKPEAIAAIRRGISAACKKSAPPPFDDQMPF
jgi:hypothetical protein